MVAAQAGGSGMDLGWIWDGSGHKSSRGAAVLHICSLPTPVAEDTAPMKEPFMGEETLTGIETSVVTCDQFRRATP